MNFKLFAIIGTFILSLFFCCIVSADPGEIDEQGGHYNQQTGEYHYHRRVVAPRTAPRTSIEKGRH